ncbi:MAG: GNAT family N-acetyltransferase [Gemmatimonadetes bacterium]|nr:GNAT family N-acetyltransferase [Gemmatimonadota bacterium]
MTSSPSAGRGEDAATRASTPIRVDVLREEAAFLALEPVWDPLLRASGSDLVFLTFDWVTAWWRRFGAGAAPRVMVARCAGIPVGIAPFVRTTHAGIRRLGLMGGKTADYKDLIVAPAARRATVAALLRALLAQRDWDYLEWTGLREDSPNLPHLADLLAEMGCATALRRPKVFTTIPLRGSWDQYFAALSKNSRKNARRQARALEEERGAVVYRRAATPGDVERFMDALVRQHVERWRAHSGYSALESPTLAATYRDVARRFLASGRLRLSVLMVRDQVAATDLGFEHAGVHFSCLTSMSGSFAPYSVGRLLLLRIIEDAFRDGLRTVDLLQGDEPYKAEFSPEVRGLHTLGLAAPGWRGSLASTWAGRLQPWLVRRIGSSSFVRRLQGRRLRAEARPI